jgi:hypothetical protein
MNRGGRADSTIGALTEAWRYAVIVCSTERRACDRLFAIANAFEKNEVIEELYGDVRGETWHSTRLILKNGVCIDAIGAGSNTRGMRYLSSRPQWVLLDDIEECSAQRVNSRKTGGADALVQGVCSVPGRAL